MSSSKATANSLRVLIIDDDAADVEIFKQYLDASQPGAFIFAESGTGKSGLARLRSFKPDCVLLDLNLPDLDGLEMIRRLNHGGEVLPCAVVMLTAAGSEQIAVEAMKLGVMDYMVKGPASSAALSTVVASAIHRSRLQRRVIEEQERYRTLAEAIPQLVWTADSGGRVQYANQRLRNYAGVHDEEVWSLASVVHPDERSGLTDKWNEAVEAQLAFDRELRLRRAHDGAFRRHLMRAAPIRNAEGDAVRWFGTFTDLEDQKRSEEALRQRQKLDSIGLLAGGVAHDFNNLLTGIMGGASFALDTIAKGHPARSMLELVVRSSEKAAHLTQQLLEYAGKGKTLLEPVDFSEIARDTCELVQASVPRTIQIVDRTDPRVPPIETNAAQMQQLVMNLVINAAEAIESKRGVVTVRTSMESVIPDETPVNVLDYALPAGEYVLLDVSDSGTGMDEHTQTQIFDPFFTTKFTGRGLGLAAVQGIVRSMGGAIQVSSALGRGSTFRVLLPARTVPAAALPLPRQEFATDRSGILIIDDDETVRFTAVAALERAGYEVLAASGGSAGLDRYRSHHDRIGLILLDMNMPEMSGREVLTQLRRISSRVSVAILSAYSDQELSCEFGGVTITEFIHKPFTAASLISDVNRIFSTAGDNIQERAGHGAPV